MSDKDNFWKNPDDDIRGGWCVTDVESMIMEYCDVPYCGERIYSSSSKTFHIISSCVTEMTNMS